jgi:hypothetical protein
MDRLWKDGEAIASGVGRAVVKNLKVMARMGVYFEEEVQRRYPDFPVRAGEYSWEDYLPPFGAHLRRLIEKYDESQFEAPLVTADSHSHSERTA